MENKDYQYDNYTFENYKHVNYTDEIYIYRGHTYQDIIYRLGLIRHICDHVILPIFVSVGLVVNVVAFCVWVFGQKSKSMCCAIYFAAISAFDFLYLTHPLMWQSAVFGWYEDIIPRTDFSCKLMDSFYGGCFQLSTCISASITVERSLTILFPFVFKSQDLRKRSKIVLAVIILLQPFMQSMIYYDRISEYGNCLFSSDAVNKAVRVFYAVVVVIIPFAVILTFNMATVATLIRQRLIRHSLTGRRDNVNEFTKVTLLTGVSFCLTYTLSSVLELQATFCLEMSFYMNYITQILIPPAIAMIYFNKAMNPIICYVVCKSVRDDIKHFIARRIQRCCASGRSQRENRTPNVARGTPAIENEELTAKIAGTRCSPNVETTSV